MEQTYSGIVGVHVQRPSPFCRGAIVCPGAEVAAGQLVFRSCCVCLGSCNVLLGYRWQRCDYLFDHIVPSLASEVGLFWSRLTAALSAFACSVLRLSVAERMSAQWQRLQQGSLCFARAECVCVCVSSCSVLLGCRRQRCDCLFDHTVPALAAEVVVFGTDLQRH